MKVWGICATVAFGALALMGCSTTVKRPPAWTPPEATESAQAAPAVTSTTVAPSPSPAAATRDEVAHASRQRSATAPATPVDCSASRPRRHSAGLSTESIRHGHFDRRYQMYVPQSYDGSRSVPVVFTFHGYGSSPDDQ